MRYILKHTEPESNAYEDNTPLLYYVFDTQNNTRVSSYHQRYKEAKYCLNEWLKSEQVDQLKTASISEKSLLEDMFNETCKNLCKWPDLIDSQIDLFEHHCKDCILKKYLI